MRRTFSIVLGVLLVYLLCFGANDVLGQPKTKSTPKKTTPPAATKPPAVQPSTNLQPPPADPNRGETRPSVTGVTRSPENEPKPRAEIVTVAGDPDPLALLTFEAPFLEKCPEKSVNGKKVICVGIARGSDVATPEEVDGVHKTLSRLFFGQRFVMVRLTGNTLMNQQDEAQTKGCHFFLQTRYKSANLSKNSGTMWTEVADMTMASTPEFTKAVTKKVDNKETTASGSKVEKSEKEKEQTAQDNKNLASATINVAKSWLGGGGGGKRAEIGLDIDFYRTEGAIQPFAELRRIAKAEKNADAAAESVMLFNMLRESAEIIQFVVNDPANANIYMQEKKKKN